MLVPGSAEDKLPDSSQRVTSKQLVRDVGDIFKQKYGMYIQARTLNTIYFLLFM